MKTLTESEPAYLRLRQNDADEKHKVSAAVPFIQEQAGFFVSSEAKKRTVCSLESDQPDYFLKKAVLEKTGRKYFVDNLPLILSHNQILSQCLFFKTPIHLNNGTVYEEIKTIVSSNTVDIEATLKSLRDSELAFVVYHSSVSNKLNLTLSLFSNKSGKEDIKKMSGGYLGGGLEFFGIAFILEFDSNDDLIAVSPGRGVNERFRQNGICTSVSLAALTKIYEHLGSKKTLMSSFSASHIGTVKFYYPLNCFFRKSTSESLRNFDPRSSSLIFDNIEKRQECLDVFQFNPNKGTYAECPDKHINLEKLLLQYQVLDALIKKMGIT